MFTEPFDKLRVTPAPKCGLFGDAFHQHKFLTDGRSDRLRPEKLIAEVSPKTIPNNLDKMEKIV
ncbi:MAG: hypothetical protein ACYTXA_19065 [Nostoc sp.]